MKKQIALVTGGYSGEAEVSYKSAETIFANINRLLYDVYYIDISKNGWFYVNEEGGKSAVDKADFSINAGNRKIVFDAVLMCIHGTPGEDGKLQGYFNMLNIPFSCCDATTSALTFNKRYTVAVAAFNGIDVARSVHLIKSHPFNLETIAASLQFPVFVKPNNGGSSIGMSKVSDSLMLADAVGKAFNEDDQILVEEFISGREFTIGVYRANHQIVALPVTEIISKNDFFDYEAKYLGASEEITPAAIDSSLKEKIEATAKNIYAFLNCAGVIRIDFIYNKESDKLYMLEVNTVPGQSNASIIPQQVRAAGLTLEDFYGMLLQETLAD